ncbi:MAG: hypothetical protein KBT48_04785 [Firmicutes bacterium]|nr:hypothetical protein [Bacillota bacterium]
MKKCKNCHKYCEDYLDVCPNCGRPADRFVEEAQPSFFTFEEVPVKKKSNLPKTILVRIGISLLTMMILSVGFISMILILPDDEEELDLPSISINQDNIESFSKLYNTYEEQILDNAPFHYFQTKEVLIPYFEERGWESNLYPENIAFSKNGVIVTFAFEGEDAICHQARIQCLKEFDQDLINALREVASEYTVQELGKTISESPFGISENIISTLQIEGTLEEYGSYKQYSMMDDKLIAGYFESEEGDNIFFVQGYEEGKYYFDFFINESVQVIDIIRN